MFLLDLLIPSAKELAEQFAPYGAGGSAVFVVLTWLWAQDHSRAADRLADAEAASSHEIERLRDLNERQVHLIDPEFPSLNDHAPIPFPIKMPDGSKYNEAYNIICLEPEKPSLRYPFKYIPWHMEEASQSRVFQEWFGDALTTDENLKAGYRFVKDDAEKPCLLWRGKTEIEITGHRIFRKLYPFVIFRRLRLNETSDSDPTTRELFQFISWLAYWDAADDNINFKIQKLFRTSDFAYLRGYFQLDNLTVEGRDKPERYYLIRQVAIKIVGHYRYVIYTGYPNKHMNDPYYGYLREWWERFRIICD